MHKGKLHLKHYKELGLAKRRHQKLCKKEKAEEKEKTNGAGDMPGSQAVLDNPDSILAMG